VQNSSVANNTSDWPGDRFCRTGKDTGRTLAFKLRKIWSDKRISSRGMTRSDLHVNEIILVAELRVRLNNEIIKMLLNMKKIHKGQQQKEECF
jgi:hypothetical protein